MKNTENKPNILFRLLRVWKINYPYPCYKNPIRLSPQAQEARKQLRELEQRITANEKIF